jgi:hypothetical protein
MIIWHTVLYPSVRTLHVLYSTFHLYYTACSVHPLMSSFSTHPTHPAPDKPLSWKQRPLAGLHPQPTSCIFSPKLLETARHSTAANMAQMDRSALAIGSFAVQGVLSRSVLSKHTYVNDVS